MAALAKFTTQACAATSLEDMAARKKGFELMVQASKRSKQALYW